MGVRDGGQRFGGSEGNAGASPLSFVLLFWFGLLLMLVACMCVFPFDTAEVLSGRLSPGQIQRQSCQRRYFGIQE